MEVETASLANTVRKTRKAAGLFQEDLALEAGLDRTYIRQVERGKRNGTVIVLARIAGVLKTTRTSCLSRASLETSHWIGSGICTVTLNTDFKPVPQKPFGGR